MSIMLAQMGLSLAQSFAGYSQASVVAELQEKIQAYRNTMNKLSAARAQNAVTVNEIGVRDQRVQTDFMIERTAIEDQGAAAVSAAAAGVAGNSVDQIARDLRGSAGRASYASRREAHNRMVEFGGQRTSISIAAITNEDIQVIPKPSIGTTLLGAGTNLLSIYDSHQPEGSRIL